MADGTGTQKKTKIKKFGSFPEAAKVLLERRKGKNVPTGFLDELLDIDLHLQRHLIGNPRLKNEYVAAVVAEYVLRVRKSAVPARQVVIDLKVAIERRVKNQQGYEVRQEEFKTQIVDLKLKKYDEKKTKWIKRLAFAVWTPGALGFALPAANGLCIALFATPLVPVFLLVPHFVPLIMGISGTILAITFTALNLIAASLFGLSKYRRSINHDLDIEIDRLDHEVLEKQRKINNEGLSEEILTRTKAELEKELLAVDEQPEEVVEAGEHSPQPAAVEAPAVSDLDVGEPEPVRPRIFSRDAGAGFFVESEVTDTKELSPLEAYCGYRPSAVAVG